MSKILGIVAVVVVAVVIVTAGMFLLLKSGDDDGNGGNDGKAMVFNGVEYTWVQLEANFQNKTVGEYVGISLSDIMNSTAFADLESDAQNETMFTIIDNGEDYWQKNVSWADLWAGIIMEEDSRTYFPHLPNAFNVKYVDVIEPIDFDSLTIIKEGGNMMDNKELTWSGLFEDLAAESFVQNNQDYTGICLVDVLEHAGFADLENATFTLVGIDLYSPDPVNYTQLQGGYLVEDQYKSVFVGMPGSYKVKNLIRIIVEY